MIEKSLKIYQSTKNKINALSYAMYMINWDSETEAPVGCLEERSKQLGNITEMIVSLSHKKTYVNALKDIIANKDKVIEKLEEGKEVVLEIEVQGALQVKAKMPDAVFIFIAPPSWKALESRLKNRGTESTEVIMERLTKAKGELMLASSYDYIVVNDEIENAVDKIIAIIRAEHAKCERALERYYELMEE